MTGTRADYPRVKSVLKEILRRPELELFLESGSEVVLLDARTPKEYAVSHLADARLTPELDDAVLSLAESPKDANVVVYCSVGYRSADLVKQLRTAGFTNVRNLEGSIFEWRNRDLPVYRDGEVVQVVHPFNAGWGRLLQRQYWSFGDED